MASFSSSPALPIYNQNFAVVRDTLSLDLKAGINQVRATDATARATDATAQVEPEAALSGLVRQLALALPALRKAHEQAVGEKDKLWWIDAAIQEVEDALRKATPVAAR